MAATRSGVVGLVAVSLVVQELNTVIALAQCLGQHTEDEGVATLDEVGNPGVVTLSGAQVQVSLKVIKSLIESQGMLCMLSLLLFAISLFKCLPHSSPKLSLSKLTQNDMTPEQGKK